MIINTEQLRQKAHELALTHDPYIRRRPSSRLWHDFYADVQTLRAYIRSLQDGSASCSQPAEEWLLDHAEFIEEQVLIIRRQLSGGLLRDLPHLRKSGETRVLSICSAYLEHADGILNEDLLVSFANAYQEVSVLTIAEVWAIPLILRIALIRRLAEVMEQVRERREVCTLVGRLLSRIEPAKLNPELLNNVLDSAGQDIPLSGPLIAHLTRHLREWAEDSATVREWLMCKLENGPESLDQIVSYEYQLQAAYQVTTGNLISSLRKISRIQWQERFEQICVVESTLRKESAGVYPLLDFSSRDVLRKRVEKLAGRLRVPENLVAQKVVELAAQNCGQLPQEQAHEGGTAGSSADASMERLPRQAFVSYYLLEPDGIAQLRRALKACSAPRHLIGTGFLRHATGAYFTILTGFFAVALLGFALWISDGAKLSTAQWLLVLLALLLPASEWAVTAVHWLICSVREPRPLLRYDFSYGIPPEATSMVVIPVIWSSVKEVREMVARLEMHYLANRDPNIHFALLGDFVDADKEKLPEDEAILAAARAGIEELNCRYAVPGGSTFHLYQRRRLWNPSEGVWMGWERKRGKLVEFVELLKGKIDTSYSYVVGDSSVLPRIRYIITLDADTHLPLGSAQRMIGTMHLPYNRPRLNSTQTRVVEGYGILQPHIGISHGASLRSRFAHLWSADPGIDPYTFAVSDPYQDGLGQGIFTGKGIFDVEAFAKILCDRIPENRVLSHDLLEGGFLRAGLLSDIELIDEHPAAFSAYQKRMHRWVRGDWQLLLWLFPRVRDRKGVSKPVDLSPFTRWQMIDNLRRSLLPPVLIAVLLTLSVLPGASWRWFVVVLATLFLPLLRQMVSRRTFWRPRNLLATAGQVLLTVLTLPFQSVLLMDAIIKTLYRLFVLKRHLLEWVSAAAVERQSRAGRYPVLLGMPGGYILTVLQALTVTAIDFPVVQWSVWTLCAGWTVTPLIVRWMDQPVEQPARPPAAAEDAQIRKLAKQIWAFFEDYVTETDHWLPPDNVQFDPPNGIAHRTSPTNIGLYLACALAARDLELIDTPGLVERLERSINTVERLEKWNGHLYNWYDTLTLEPLPPKYVSTVDSGNFVGCLITIKEGLAEWLREDHAGPGRPGPGQAGARMEEALDVAFAVELAPDLKVEQKFDGRDWHSRGQRLIDSIEALISGTDFRPLYNHKAKLFSLGYHAGLREPDKILYDLAASEARLSSFIAIALGQVSVSHWHALGRTMTRVGRRVAFLSWSGTMFEYLMPWLFMRTYRNTVWDSTYHAVVQRQIAYAHQRGVPFGISESGYYAFDFRMNYQYRAFGVPGLGFKRGLEQDLVVAPYATILALPFQLRQGLKDLQELEKLGARGAYGFFEAVDFTAERLPKEQKYVVIKSYMAHHQGMSLLAISNLLAPKKIYERFHHDRRVQAAELLLQERIPPRPQIIKQPAVSCVNVAEPGPAVPGGMREFLSADTPAPEVCILSNGSLMTVVTNSGSGFCSYEGLAVTRWQEDPVLDNWGSYLYIRDVNLDRVWSPSYQPCRVRSEHQRTQFSLDKATFMREDGDIKTSLEICVSPEWNAEVRRLTLTNTGSQARIIEVTTFLELVLAPPVDYDAHPAFSKLFIKTGYVEESQCLLACRRPRRENGRPLWAAHSLKITDGCIGPVEYETSRSVFIGRGRTLARPQGIRTRMQGTVGSVADPAFVMRRRVKIESGAQVQLFAITAVAGTREEALEIVGRFPGELVVDRTFQMAWNRSQIELTHLRLTAVEANLFHIMAGRVLYTPPLGRDRRAGILNNKKGQPGLWSYGISGDNPVILARIRDMANIKFLVQLLIGHEYLRRLGLFFDLVILNESAGGYQQDLQGALRRTVEQNVDRHSARPGGIFIINAGQLPEDDITLLMSVARVVLRADGPSLRAQLRPAGRAAALPGPLAPVAPFNRFGAEPGPEKAQKLLFFNGWGGFLEKGRYYQILLKNGNNLPAPWSNVIANPRFGCLVTERGTGYTWWRNSREFKLTPWSNDPVLDPPGEVCYLRDEESGELWSATPLTLSENHPYTVTHGRGFTCFNHERHGVSQELSVYVPLNDPVKVIKLQLQNRSGVKRRISVTYYVEWVLGVSRRTGASFVVTEWDKDARVMLAYNTYQEIFRDAYAFLGVYPQEVSKGPLSSTEMEKRDDNNMEGLSWTADRSEFLGRNGDLENPAALRRERLSGQTGAIYDTCGAVQARLVLEAGAERTVYILLGCEQSREKAVRLAQKYSRPGVCDQAFKLVQEFWDGVLEQVQVATPSPAMDVLLNGWLLYQTLACRMWARAAFYQAGGAFGFRDQLQDSLALLHTRPDLAKKQILLHASHQYEEGDVQHWWHEETKRGIRTGFSDDLLWLPYAVGRYIEHTGDDSILDEEAPFLHSEPLPEGEAERYGPTVESTRKGSVFEHCLRAIERALQRFGEHGLPLIGTGDWNDGLSNVGAKGRGESVWLGWFLSDVLNRFAGLCLQRGQVERAEHYRRVCSQLVASLDEHAWDGQWYRRAFTDEGKWLGSIFNEECRIDAIAQSWSVISGAAPQDKALQAMQSFDRELVDRETSVACLLTPPFDRSEPSPGYIQGYPPGIRENGAQYTHGAIWSIIAWCKLGKGEQAFELFELLNPLNHTRTANEVRQYCGEPYVMAADVYTMEPHRGRAGWTWYTGAAGWMYQAGLEWILGLRRRGARLYINPCIPGEWPEFSVNYRFGSTRYLITVKNPSRRSSGVTRLQIDGRDIALKGQTDKEGCYVELQDDGQAHNVQLVL